MSSVSAMSNRSEPRLAISSAICGSTPASTRYPSICSRRSWPLMSSPTNEPTPEMIAPMPDTMNPAGATGVNSSALPSTPSTSPNAAMA
jgi:hypothetical protein